MHQYILYLGLGLWCLTPLSTIIQLHRREQQTAQSNYRVCKIYGLDPCNALGSVGVSETYSFYGCSKKATCESDWENNSRSWSMETPIFSLVVSVDIAISALQQQRVSRDV